MKTSNGHVIKVVALALLSVLLGATVLFCVTRVGQLHDQAAVLQACLDDKTLTGCNSTVATAGRVAGFQDQADTFGMVGWGAVFMLLFVVGSELMDTIRDSFNLKRLSSAN